MLIFFLIAVTGLMMLAASVIIGELFEFLDLTGLFDIGDFDVAGHDGGGPITTPALSLALTAFGGTGMITQWAGWGIILSVGTSLLSAIAFGAIGAWIAILFYRQSSGTEDAFAAVIGKQGEVVTSITSTPGEVQISAYGGTHTRLARSKSGEIIPSGSIVRIVDVMGNTLIVEKASLQIGEAASHEQQARA